MAAKGTISLPRQEGQLGLLAKEEQNFEKGPTKVFKIYG